MNIFTHLTTTKSSLSRRACVLILKVFWVWKKKKNYTWIATWWSMWIGCILNKTQHDELSSKCPPLPTRNNIKIQSSVSVLILCGLGWTFELQSVCFTALCLHSLLLRVQMQTKHFPPSARSRQAHRALSKSVSGAYLGFNAHTGHRFFPVFTLPYLVKEWRKYCGLDACQGLNSSKRGGDVAVPLHRGSFQ